jgi:rRNA maturation endonuclease Nob1
MSVILYCIGCGDRVDGWPCPRCGHTYVVLDPPQVQLRLFYPRAER